MAPCYDHSHAKLQLGPTHLAPCDGSPQLTTRGDQDLQFSPPTCFGCVYRRPLTREQHVTARFHANANATEIETDTKGAQVVELKMRSLDRRSLRGVTRKFAPAAGGIENVGLHKIRFSTIVETAQYADSRVSLPERRDALGLRLADHLSRPLGHCAATQE
jgi:hypothetical protein